MKQRKGWTAVILAALFVAGLWLRTADLGAPGIAEDESHKIDAVNAYLNGDITANAEHPMMMKNLMLVSVLASRWWNEHTPWTVSEEAALRFPNALFGAGTTVPLYYLAAGFFGPEIGLLSAAFWATGIHAVSFNRVGKEETLMVFFVVPAFYFYRRAKRLNRDPRLQGKYYALAGVMFGLQLAAKYLPGFWGMNQLYYHMLGRNHENQPVRKPMLRRHFLVAFGIFLIMNVSFLMPSVWVYFGDYLREKLVVHHGYQMMDTLYYNIISRSPYGTPFYFYFLYFLTKTPIPLLILFVTGLVHVFLHRKGVGRYFLQFVFIWWFLPFSLAGAKWLRYALSYTPFFYMTAAVGFFVIWRRVRAPAPSTAVAWGASFMLVLSLFIHTGRQLPYPALYTNILGEGRAMNYFPQDELYDSGFREAYQYLAKHAEQDSTVSTDAAGIFEYYTTRFQRQDLQGTSFSNNGHPPSMNHPVYVLLHEGNRYFENDSLFHYLKLAERPVAEIPVDGMIAVRIYRMQPRDFAMAQRYPGQAAHQN